MTRRRTLAEFKRFQAQRDSRSMDKICAAAGEGAAQRGFQLQAHQEFLAAWMRSQGDAAPQAMLMYHGIGSGKTCTSITMAMEWLRTHPVGRVKVLLPARLRSNYWDELLSPCTMFKFFTREQYEAYAQASSERKKKALRKTLMQALAARFEVISFDRFRREAAGAADLGQWVQRFTRDTFFVVDEVHNLLASGYKDAVYKEIEALRRLPQRSKYVNTMLFRYLVANAHEAARFVFLSATPVFDNTSQFVELVRVLDPDFEPPAKGGVRLSEAIDRLRGRVSYFPGVSPRAYPSTKYMRHNVPASMEQTRVFQALEDEDGDPLVRKDQDQDAFMLKQRMAGVAVMPRPGNPLRPSPAKTAAAVSNLRTYAPKLDILFRIMADEPGKHIVYCSFVGMGIDVIEAAMRARGWVALEDVLAGRAEARDYLVFCVWDGKTNDATKAAIKAIANAADNMDGRRLRVVIGSPSIKEGISFKHVQHLHMLDPVWNQSSKTQIEGRAVRFCSHSQVPARHPTLKRSVLVHVYRLTSPAIQTADMKIYDELIPDKHTAIAAAERALKRVSLDYLLFRRLHEGVDDEAAGANASAPLSVSESGSGPRRPRPPGAPGPGGPGPAPCGRRAGPRLCPT